MNHGFIRVAAATPEIRVGDCVYNAEAIIQQMKEANENHTALLVFPELCITGYTCGDLFLQQVLLDGSVQALCTVAKATESMDMVVVVGVPIAIGGSLYNCGAVLYHGEILALVPKQHVPAYSEFYETRHFTPGKDGEVMINGRAVPLCTQKVFACAEMPSFTFGVELCEDLWVATPPSCGLASKGATILVNLSASDEIIGKPQYRKRLVEMQSAKLMATYVYADAGMGESTTDMVFSGHNLIAENGALLTQSKRYTTGIIYADTDVQKLLHERRKMTTFVREEQEDCITFSMPVKPLDLQRTYSQTPFVPHSKEDVAQRCAEILAIQATGLATRLKHTKIEQAVLGLSGGLDSTLALLVCVNAFDQLGLDRKKIKAVTIPCFGTTKRTKSNAERLADAYGVTLMHVDISKAVLQHFKDIGHDPNVLDVTYENSQARERTQVLMDIANKVNGLVIGTGDLSELALGWATYNGDHMSMYAVNASIPKTLVRYLVADEANRTKGIQREVLEDILDTPVSPELLPPKDGTISQITEELVGPYVLHDFFLYYFMRFGFSPAKLYRIASIAFADSFEPTVIKQWLTVFFKRFFSQQFKRSCMPDSPKVGSVALSPRGDFRMPSDASAALWMKELEELQR